MPCTDPRDVTSLEEAFDLTTTEIRQWELNLIWKADEIGVLRISGHARRAAVEESIPEGAIMRLVHDGLPRSKDITTIGRRQIGINFEGKRRRSGWLRTKVGWSNEYVVVTVHSL